jgi:hypothetical protein
MLWIEWRVAAGHLTPCDPPQTDHNPRFHDRELGRQERPAIRDLGGLRITIAAVRIFWIAANQVGDENAANRRRCNHLSQQFARTIAAERNSRAVASKSPRRKSYESKGGSTRSVSRHDSRPASHQRRAFAALEHRGLQLFKLGHPELPVVSIRHLVLEFFVPVPVGRDSVPVTKMAAI